MAKSFTGRKRIRRSFGRIPEVAPMPNLIEVQKSSYDHFLQMGVPPEGRTSVGLQEVFKSVFPIRDFSDRARLEFVRYELEEPKYDVEECQQRGITFAAPLKVTLRLVVWDVDEETGSRSIRDIKEQDVYMGDMPLMTKNGTFIINGTERVIVSQMHRSPGVFFDHDKGKTHSSGKYLFAARVIPYRGSWLDFEFDAKDHVYVRIDRRRKLPVTTLLLALDSTATAGAARRSAPPRARRCSRYEAQGMSKEEILASFYDSIRLHPRQEGLDGALRSPALSRRRQADRTTSSTPRPARRAPRPAASSRRAAPASSSTRACARSWSPRRSWSAAILAIDVINEDTGESTPRPATRSPRRSCCRSKKARPPKLPVLAIDHVTVGPYIRNTLMIDKNAAREDALIDIYRVMRPGEPPTLETAEALFKGLFFDQRALRPLGRRPGQDELASQPDHRRPGARAPQGGHPGDPQGARRAQGRARRDRRHRPSRQPPRALGRRADGEPVPRRPAAHGAGDPRAHELGRDRHGDAA